GCGDGTFERQITYSTGISPSSVAVGDFNNDSRLDIIVTNSGSGDVSLFLGHSNATFERQTNFSIGNRPWSVTVGDFNNDTLLDIAVANRWSCDLVILLGYGNGTFARLTIDLNGTTPWFVAAVDLNNDHQLDMIIADGYVEIGILLGYGNGTFADLITYSSTFDPKSVAIGDFNHDNRLDFVVANSRSDSLAIFMGCANEAFQRKTTLTTGMGSQPQSLVVGDFNLDKNMDIAVVNSGTNTISIFLGYGNLLFAQQINVSTGSQSSSYALAAGDFNNDNIPDIVIAIQDSNYVGIFLGYGNGSFIYQNLYSTGFGSHPYSLTVSDFNNDNLLDIAVANRGTNNIAVFIGFGNGSFTKETVFSIGYGSLPFVLIASDFNDDKKMDLVVANEGTDSVNIFLQSC
ncbi:unnamed protein product, partial [Rotaria magnacalcarata]